MDSSDMNSCDAGTKSNFVSTYDRIKDKEITPNAGPVVNGGADIFIEADYIYWYVSQDGLNYAAGGVLPYQYQAFGQGLSVVAPSNNVLAQQSRAGIKGRMASGFKVAGGLDLGYDGWDTLARYTWLRVHSYHHHNDCHGPVITGARFSQLLEGFHLLDFIYSGLIHQYLLIVLLLSLT